MMNTLVKHLSQTLTGRDYKLINKVLAAFKRTSIHLCNRITVYKLWKYQTESIKPLGRGVPSLNKRELSKSAIPAKGVTFSTGLRLKRL